MAEELTADATAVRDAGGDVGEMVRAAWRFGQVRPAFMMIVISLLVEGHDVTAVMGDHPFARVLVDRLGGPTSEEAKDDAGVVLSMIISGTVLRTGINGALGRETGDQRLM